MFQTEEVWSVKLSEDIPVVFLLILRQSDMAKREADDEHECDTKEIDINFKIDPDKIHEEIKARMVSKWLVHKTTDQEEIRMFMMFEMDAL